MFKNRNAAALLLVEKLKKYKNQDGVVLAVPRGGIPIGYIMAKELNFPLEIVLSKKIGYPGNPEFAIGSVTLDNVILDAQAVNIPKEYIDRETERIKKDLALKYAQFMGDRKPANLEGKTVIIADDGVATGNTLMATVKLIKKSNPKRIIVAVPVAPPETALRFKNFVDEFVCLLTPFDFLGVGQFYEDFTQVSDEEVKELLGKSREHEHNVES